MTEIDALPTDQRALVELILRRGRSYRELANLLSVDLTAIRQRATAATAALGPQDIETPAQHEALTDYLLGQLPEALNIQARGLLETSKPANEWARIVAGKLEQFAPGRVGTVPELAAMPAAAPAGAPASADPARSTTQPGSSRSTAKPSADTTPQGADGAAQRTAAAPKPAAVQATSTPASSPPSAPAPTPTPPSTRKTAPYAPKHLASSASGTTAHEKSKRRLLAFGAAAVAVIIVAIALALALSGSHSKHHESLAGQGTTAAGTNTGTSTNTGTKTGSGTTTGTASKTSTTSQQTTTKQTTTSSATIESTVAMTSPAGYKGTIGVAQLISTDGSLKLEMRAEGVPANSADNAYAVWLYSNAAKKILLGFVTESVSGQGDLKIGSALPADARGYQRVLLTLETSPHPTEPGTIVLSGTL